jgi:hypothetical protein
MSCSAEQNGKIIAGLRNRPLLVTSGAALCDGEPLVEVGAGHRRHGREVAAVKSLKGTKLAKSLRVCVSEMSWEQSKVLPTL